MKKISLVLFFVLLGVCLLRGQPVNDDVADATPITVTDIFTQLVIDYTGATDENIPNGCGIQIGFFYDVWYEFNATGGDIEIRNLSGGDNISAEVLLVDENGVLVSQGCVNAAANGGIHVVAVSSSGTAFLRVSRPFVQDASLTLELKQTPGSPINDNPATATAITVTEVFTPLVINYMGATASMVANECGINPNFSYDVWYTFPGTGEDVIIKNSPGGHLVSVELFLEDENGIATSQDCIQMAPDGAENSYAIAAPGTILMRITRPFFQDASLTLELKQAPGPPINDNPATATAITVTDVFTPLVVDYVGATASMVANDCNNNPLFAYDVWYTFAATRPGIDFSLLPNSDNVSIAFFLEDENGVLVPQGCVAPQSNGSSNSVPISGPGTILMQVTRPFGQNASLTLELKQAAALPVTLTTFHAQATPGNKSTHLTWQTASETANDYFEIQRSTNGQTFTPLGRVTGAGTSNTVQNYTYTDNSPQAGTNFYRLRQVDLDGTSSLSEVRVVEFVGKVSLRIYPNPAGPGSVTVQLPESLKNQTLELIAADGRLVLSQSASVGRFFTELLVPGVYFVRVGELVERLVVR